MTTMTTMTAFDSFSRLSPAIQWHVVAALGALVLGPLALWARKGSRLHKTSGYVWVLLMLLTAGSSLFIRDFKLPNLAGYTPIHLLTFYTLGGLGFAVWAVVHRNIAAHRKAMQQVYLGACVTAGLFTLLPGRFMGQLLWRQTLGWV